MTVKERVVLLRKQGMRKWPAWGAVLVVALALLAAIGAETPPSQTRPAGPDHNLSADEFSGLIHEFSENGGYFFADNFTSNETAYLHVVDKLKELGVSGGAYIGVGPEQNFTYIVRIRPQIAFILDVRRQAILQHLLYKALFHLSSNRAQFFSLLFSKPLAEEDGPARNASLEALVDYFSQAPTSRTAFEENLSRIRKVIEKDFHFPLSTADFRAMEYVYRAFYVAHLNLSFQIGVRYLGWRSWGGFPTLRDLLLATDLHGKQEGFLVKEEDYRFLRQLHRWNRIIPVVGDFAGHKALPAIAGFLRDNRYTVSAYYTSNVEQYLFGNEVFEQFTRNVRQLPINDKSVFIRAVRAGWKPHPARVPGHRMITLLQKISVFLDDYDHGLYPDYWSLATTHYIAGTDVEGRGELEEY